MFRPTPAGLGLGGVSGHALGNPPPGGGGKAARGLPAGVDFGASVVESVPGSLLDDGVGGAAAGGGGDFVARPSARGDTTRRGGATARSRSLPAGGSTARTSSTVLTRIAERKAEREASMKAGAAAIATIKAEGRKTLGENPSAMRMELEAIRFRQNAELQSKIAFQYLVENRRKRIEALAGSKAELFRLQQVHTSEREDTRRAILRDAVRAEMELLRTLKEYGVKTVAGFAEAFG